MTPTSGSVSPSEKDGLRTFANRYLKGAPAPVWMEHGVPALMKGETLGLELVGKQR